jgi:hypothetical protein
MNRSAKHWVYVAAFTLGAFAAGAVAQNSQQSKMTSCNAEAGSKHLSGADRKTFMKTCLSATPAAAPAAAPAATGNSQQQKMKSCNADASKQALKGDARKQFMSTCLKGTGA